MGAGRRGADVGLSTLLRALIFIAALRAAHYCPSFMSEEDGYFIKRLFIWLEFFWPWH